MDWQQLLLNPDKADLDLGATAAVCAPIVALGTLAIAALIRRLGPSDGALSLSSLILGVVLGAAALTLPEALYVMSVGSVNFVDRPQTALYLAVLQLLIATGCIYALRFHKWELRSERPRTWLRVAPRALAGTAALWLLVTPLIFATIVLAVTLARLLGLPMEQQPVLRDLTSNRSTVAIVGAYLLAAVAVPLREEFFFRLVLFGGMRGVLGNAFGARQATGAAYVVSIVLFVLIHGMWNPNLLYLALPLTVLSIFLTMIYAHTRSLWPSVLLHSLYNSLVLTLQFTLG